MTGGPAEPEAAGGAAAADGAAPAAAALPAEALGRVHLIGIGGAGMSSIARILLARGIPLSGSDITESAALTALRARGATVFLGQDPAHLDGVDTVVYSSAIREANSELAAARERGLRVLPRAGALAAAMAGRRGVAVAGTHGKTTTTSMLTVALRHCGADPSFSIGADLDEPGSNAHSGSGELFVAEADESDGSFLLLAPFAALVTNVEADHLDYYADAAAVDAAFAGFVARVDPAGFLVVCADDPGSAALATVAAGRGLATDTYGAGADADVRLAGLTTSAAGSSFTLVDRGRECGRVRLRAPGLHNALNAAAALTAGLRLGLPFAGLAAGLAGFTGTRRRFEPKGTAGGVRVYDDYAHHPTEITATLQSARDVAAGGRLIVAFQPHRYSRTLAFREAFGVALGRADAVVVLEVYGAGEAPIPGATGAAVAAAVPLPPSAVAFEPSFSAVPALLAGWARAGDLVLTLGAGDVTLLGPVVLAALAAPAAAGPAASGRATSGLPAGDPFS